MVLCYRNFASKRDTKDHWLKLYMIVYAYDFLQQTWHDFINNHSYKRIWKLYTLIMGWHVGYDAWQGRVVVTHSRREIQENCVLKFMRHWRIRRANTLVMIIFHVCDLDNDTDERMIIIMMVMMVVVMMPSHGYYLNSWDSWGEDLLSLHRWRNGRGLRKRKGWTRWTVKHDVSPDGVMPPCFFP